MYVEEQFKRWTPEDQREHEEFVQELEKSWIGFAVVWAIRIVAGGALAAAYLAVIFGISYAVASRLNAVLLGVPLILLLGWILFRVRKAARAFYGVMEIVFALLLGGLTIARAGGDETFWEFLSVWNVLGIASSCYIVVRGMDNCDHAREEKMKRTRSTQANQPGLDSATRRQRNLELPNAALHPTREDARG